MNLLDLMVKIGVDDKASDQIGTLTTGAIAKATAMGNAIYDIVKGGVGAMVNGTKAIVSGALDGYKNYEQLVGGVDKLYQGASDKLQKYAQDAYKTAGMSANQYMEQATSFSSSLINSLGGDTEKAAEQTDKAMRLMSDNVNTFGSDMGNVQNAIQGLSRENYTMLDNLKLGYAGTKEGMEELIADAEKYAQQIKNMGFDEYVKSMENSGLSVDELRKRYDELSNSTDLTMGNFSDMIDAIDIIQEKQHIMGTTAKEAMTTIEGSVTAAKASWENLLTAIGSGDTSMIDQSITGLVDSIFGTFNQETGKREGGVINNVLPILENVGKAIIGKIPELGEKIAWNFIEVINQTFGTDFDAEGIMVGLENVGKRITDFFTGFFAGFNGALDTSGAQGAFDRILEALGQVWTFIEETILANGEQIGAFLGTVATVVGQVADAAMNLFTILSPYLPFIATLVATFGVLMPIISGVAGVIGAISGAVTFLTTVVMPALAMIQSVSGAVTALVTILGGPITIIAAIAAAIVAFIATNEQARAAIVGAWNAVVNFFRGLPDTLGKVWNSIKEDIDELVSNATKNWEGLKNAATEKWTAMQSAIREKMDGIRDKVASGWQTLKDNVVGKLGELKTNVLNGWEGIKKDVTEKMQGLKDGVTERFEAVVNFVRDIPSKIKSALGDLGGLLWDAGSSIIDGLWDGMASVAESMMNWVSGIADTIASLKGPLPYDRKVLVENGLALMSGLYKGIEKGFEDTVMPYVSTLADQMQESMEVQPLVAPRVSYEYAATPAKTQQEATTVRDDAVVSLLTAILSTMPQSVVLDSGALVGELAPDINVALGSLL